MSCKLFTLAILLVCLLGCDEQRAKPATNEHTVPPEYSLYPSLKGSDILVTANGISLTKKDVEEECDIQTSLLSFSKRKLKDTQIEKKMDRLRSTAIPRFLLRRAVLDEANRRSLTVSDEEFLALRTRFVQSTLHSSKVKAEDYAKITNRLSVAQAAILDHDLRQDALYQKVLKILREECRVSISPEEAEKKFKQVEAYNVRADAAEHEIFHQATNVWNKLKAGKDFEAAVADLSGQAPRIDADMNWGTFQRGFFAKDDPAISAALGSMEVGDFTPPLLGNGGLVIFQVTARQPSDNPADLGGDHYQLAKIFFQLPEKFDLSDKEQFRKDYAEELSKKKLDEKLKQLRKELKTEYPNGKIRMNENEAHQHAKSK
jgi:hypothetical protein